MKKLLSIIKKEKIIQRYAVLIVCLFLAAISFNLFLSPLKIVTGGSNGISILFQEMLNVSPSIIIFSFSIITLIIGFLVLGNSKTIGAVFSSFLYPVFVDITSDIGSLIKIDTSDLLITSIFAGIILGVTSGYIYKVKLSQGGVILISESIARTFKTSISRINFTINAFIVLIGCFVFGIINSLYAIIILFISNVVMDRILLGVSDNKLIYIMTKNEEEIKKYVFSVMRRGITEFDAISGESGNKKKLLVTVVPTREYVKILEFIKKVDINAFVVVTDSNKGSKL